MGRIKTIPIKRATLEVFRRYQHKLTDKFEENKKILDEILEYRSKKIRNAIAGYVTRLMSQGKAE